MGNYCATSIPQYLPGLCSTDPNDLNKTAVNIPTGFVDTEPRRRPKPQESGGGGVVPYLTYNTIRVFHRFRESSLHCHMESPVWGIVSAVTEWKAIMG